MPVLHAPESSHLAATESAAVGEAGVAGVCRLVEMLGRVFAQCVGGVISPLLLNIALQGMEEAAGVRYDSRGAVKRGCPTVITYADDFVALCHSREQAETVQARISAWLKDRGLSLNQEKTRIGRIDGRVIPTV